jgi:hypothetical protein
MDVPVARTAAGLNQAKDNMGDFEGGYSAGQSAPTEEVSGGASRGPGLAGT